jgi:hypothetical protein
VRWVRVGEVYMELTKTKSYQSKLVDWLCCKDANWIKLRQGKDTVTYIVQYLIYLILTQASM